MGLKATIVYDKGMAMKMRDSQLSTILGTLIGELDRIEKEPNDATVLKVIQKIVDNNTEFNMNPLETQVLSQYLPKKLDEVELTSIIVKQIQDNGYCTVRDTGKIMKFLQGNYPSQFDGNTANKVIKANLPQ